MPLHSRLNFVVGTRISLPAVLVLLPSLLLITFFETARSQSEDVTVRISGEIIDMVDASGLFRNKVSIGDAVTGEYTYNFLTPDSDDNPIVGDYPHFTSPYGVVVQMGKVIFRTDPNNVNYLIELVNEPTEDFFVFHSYNNLALSKKILAPTEFTWQLNDPSGQALSSDSMQDAPKAPDLSKWEQPSGLIIQGKCSLKHDRNCSEVWSFQARITSARVVSD